MQLKPFQIDGAKRIVKFLKNNKSNGAYLADEMGLGKTAQAIEACNQMKFRNVLVICPAVVVGNWAKEIMWWSHEKDPKPYPSLITVANTSAQIKKLRGANWAITTYGLAAKEENAKELSEGKWDCLILDESHYVKSTSSLRSKSILKVIWPKVKYRICLSGTPITDCVVDGYTLFSRLMTDDPRMNNWHSFANRYANQRRSHWARSGVEYYGLNDRTALELSEKIRKNFFIRRLKESVMKELPPKIFTRITLPKKYLLKVPKTEEEALQLQAQLVIDAIEKGTPPPAVATSLQGQRKQQGKLKVKPAVEFILEFLEQKIPIVVFAYHTEVMAALNKALNDYSPSVITGSTPNHIRPEQVRRFQDGETNLFLGQIIAAGVGITLTRASYCVLVEHDWSPHVILQACDRLHRITQKECVNIYSLVVEGSLDERIVETVIRKAEEIAKVLN